VTNNLQHTIRLCLLCDRPSVARVFFVPLAAETKAMVRRLRSEPEPPHSSTNIEYGLCDVHVHTDRATMEALVEEHFQRLADQADQRRQAGNGDTGE